MNRTVSSFAPVVALGIGVLLISGLREQRVVPPVQPMAAVQRAFSGYQGVDHVVPEAERKVAGMTDYSYRDFKVDSALAFSVYVGYYDRQVQGKSIHSPKNCLPGAGFEITQSERVSIPGAGPTATMNRAILASGQTRALVYYWYQGRGRSESSEYRVKWNLLRDAALFARTEEALVRIVINVRPSEVGAIPLPNDAQIGEADALAQKVARELWPSVESILPKSPAA